MKFKNGKIPLDSLNSNGWGIASKYAQSIIKSIVGSRVKVAIDDTDTKNHRDDDNRYSDIGIITNASLSPASSPTSQSYIIFEGEITDSVAEKKLVEGTWKSLFSPHVMGLPSTTGFIDDPQVKYVTVVDKPAWKESSFDIVPRAFYASESPILNQTSQTNQTNPPSTDSNDILNKLTEQMAKMAEQMATMQQKINQNESNTTSDKTTTSDKIIDKTMTSDKTTTSDGAAINTKNSNESDTMTDNTDIKQVIASLYEKIEKLDKNNGLSQKDVIAILAGQKEVEAHSQAVASYVKTMEAKGLKPDPGILKTFEGLTSEQIHTFENQMASIQTKPIITGEPTTYYDETTGAGGYAYVGGLSVGYPDPNNPGKWIGKN